MIRIRLLMLLLAAMLPLAGIHAGSVLVVELNGGSTERFALQDKPELTMSGTKLVVKSTAVEKSYERSAVRSFYFEDSGTGIEELKDNTISYRQTGVNQFLISGLSVDERVTVNNLSGQLFNQTVSQNGDEAFVNLSECPKGVYIIKIGKNNTIKIIKR